jgi:hypothetical protein
MLPSVRRYQPAEGNSRHSFPILPVMTHAELVHQLAAADHRDQSPRSIAIRKIHRRPGRAAASSRCG